MKVIPVLLMTSSMGICLQAHETHSLSLEQLFPTSASTYVLDTCMQVCSDLVLLDSLKEKLSSFWMDALLGKMARLQVGIERLVTSKEQPGLHADDLIYLLAMITRVDIAAESTHIDADYQAVCHTLLHAIKARLAHLITQEYSRQ